MHVKYINSATVVVESNGIKVLCDPWLVDGAYYGSWCHYPPLDINIEDFFDIDYIYISHVHPDHLNIETLSQFPKNIPILIHDYEQKFVSRILGMIGFEKIIEIGHKKVLTLGNNFSIEILAADNCDPEKCGLFLGCSVGPGHSKSLSIDTIAVFNSKDSVVVNTNDCPYDLAKDVCRYIKSKYKEIDLLLVGYLGAGPFPQCFPDINEDEKIIACENKKNNFFNQTIKFITALEPQTFIPFAGKYTLAGTLHKLNKWRGNPEQEELYSDFLPLLDKKNINSHMLLLDRDFEINVKDRNVPSNYKKINTYEKDKYIINNLSKRKFTYQSEEIIQESLLYELLNKAQDRKLNMQKIYNFYSNWNLYLEVDNKLLIRVPYVKEKIEIDAKLNNDIPWIKVGVDLNMLSAIMKRKAHWNNLEIGSHLKFYRSEDTYVRGIHHFLSFFHA